MKIMRLEGNEMRLTAEEMRAVVSGRHVRFTQNGAEFVVIRSEDFDKLTTVPDAGHQELRMMLARSSEANGWDEPGMDAYDTYPAHR